MILERNCTLSRQLKINDTQQALLIYSYVSSRLENVLGLILRIFAIFFFVEAVVDVASLLRIITY